MKAKKPLVMGIINVTPDSFYENSGSLDAAMAKAEECVSEGADILDLGAESTRPSAEPVPEDEEAIRLLPVLKEIRRKYPKILISVDTYKTRIAHEALQLGADIINDISADANPVITSLASEFKANIVLMHMRGTPQTMDKFTQYDNILKEMKKYFETRIEACLKVGVAEDKIILDPGFGFAKTMEQNYFVLKNLDYFKKMGFPLLVGMSRKRFLAVHKGDSPADRLYSTLAANVYARTKGADIFRVHDVREHREALDTMENMI